MHKEPQINGSDRTIVISLPIVESDNRFGTEAVDETV